MYVNNLPNVVTWKSPVLTIAPPPGDTTEKSGPLRVWLMIISHAQLMVEFSTTQNLSRGRPATSLHYFLIYE